MNTGMRHTFGTAKTKNIFKDSTHYYKFEEQTGNPLDSIGNVDLIKSGNIQSVVGKINLGVEGIVSETIPYSYLAIPRSVIQPSVQIMQFSCWFYYDNSRYFVINNRGSNFRGIRIVVNNSEISCVFWNVAALGAEPVSLFQNSFNHIAVTRNGNNIKIYINSVLAYDKTASEYRESISDNFYVGANIDSSGEILSTIPFIVDELETRNILYTQEFVDKMYNSGIGRTI